MTEFFADSDSFIEHVKQTVCGLNDDYLASRYIGFVAVSAVTVYEVAVKKLLKEFAQQVHPILGIFASVTFAKLNARITRDNIEKYIRHFGDEYVSRFKSAVNNIEETRIKEGSVKESYQNLLTWRHEFVHTGTLPNQATFGESILAYHLGKEVIFALEETCLQNDDTFEAGGE